VVRSHRRSKAQHLTARTAGLERAEQSDGIDLLVLMKQLEAALPAGEHLVQENGLLDMWSYFYLCFTLGAEQKSIVPSEQTSLGFGVAAAIGAKAAKPIVRSLRWWATVRSTSAAPTYSRRPITACPSPTSCSTTRVSAGWKSVAKARLREQTVRARKQLHHHCAGRRAPARGEHLRFSQPIYYSAGAQHAGADRDRRRARDQPAAAPGVEDFEST